MAEEVAALLLLGATRGCCAHCVARFADIPLAFVRPVGTGIPLSAPGSALPLPSPRAFPSDGCSISPGPDGSREGELG